MIALTFGIKCTSCFFISKTVAGTKRIIFYESDMHLLKQNHLNKRRVDIVLHWQPTIDVGI